MLINQYDLLDFGRNEKLECIGGVVVRRETPSAPGGKASSVDWGQARLRGRVVGDKYSWDGIAPSDWRFDAGDFQLKLKPTPSGQVGVFPEQSVNWDWLKRCPSDLAGLKAINLFGYTGATTLSLANRGAQVVHVDAAKSVVSWARANAQTSGLADSPIRWMVEDALTFVRRELKRGNKYDIIVADPPSFGRGPKGERWKLQRDLFQLIESLSELSRGRCKMVLLSCHTPGVDHRQLRSEVENQFHFEAGTGDSFALELRTQENKSLPSGNCFRWVAD
ncbi:class I SAM-dependent methyltransferase [bacterium]|nr:class I SAM-dependent methyltransferase [bacterium]MDB2525220.1 class I SAM-dependent methyltransferase [Mariniblastus sp.]